MSLDSQDWRYLVQKIKRKKFKDFFKRLIHVLPPSKVANILSIKHLARICSICAACSIIDAFNRRNKKAATHQAENVENVGRVKVKLVKLHTKSVTCRLAGVDSLSYICLMLYL